MLQSTMSLKEAKNVLGIQNITESSASKNGREFLFVSFTCIKTGEIRNCVVSENALEDYKSGKFNDLCISQIYNDAEQKLEDFYSIHKTPSNKVKKECAW